MTPREFTIAGWSSWRPDEPGAVPAEQLAAGDVPPMVRRRFSLLTKMVLETGAAALRAAGLSPTQAGKVFASRHGEIQTLSGLFGDLAEGAPLSPTAFSTSVHHSAAGYLGIVYGNTFPSRAVSAGDASFAAGLLEAFGMIRRHGIPVLLVFADGAFPERFLGLSGGTPPPIGALALVLNVANSTNGPALSWRSESEPGTLLPGDLLRWLTEPAAGEFHAGFWNGSLVGSK
jgi:hypothetical protein